ncbi:MAG: bis(5'-nucleosyl)-tetraphosphatase (symmetrical) YqeK [Halanaerobiales bacterium]|nr:bis(5'-nucleosyl)-tetraphosphatase (symmetrical) YqeK [Halanaerobiales bacterium]
MIDIKSLKTKLKEIDGFRYEHSCFVKDTAVKLAKKYKADTYKVKLAALLHDYARNYSNEKLIDIVNKNNIEVDEWEREIPELLHSPVAAFIADDEFGIKDNEIIDAIRYHTIGRPKMSKIEKIIFLADIIEPSRDFPDINYIREAADNNLDKAVLLVCDFTIKYNIEQNKIIHPNTLLARNELLKGEN